MIKEENDPFDCFGSEEEEVLRKDVSSISVVNNKEGNRHDDCGVLSFHPNTESSLLVHVQNKYARIQQQAGSKNLGIAIMECMDEFCYNRHWMMNVGPEKGQIVSQVLLDCIQTKQSSNNNDVSFHCVELGTYCGYASILLATILQQQQGRKGHLWTVEINPMYQTIAKQLVEMAQLQDYVTFVPLNLNYDGTTQNVATVVSSVITDATKIDFLFIDHDKDKYLHDLQLFERHGLLQTNTTVVADNVIFAQIHDYINYMKNHQTNGIVHTQTHMSKVEYSTSPSSQPQNQNHKDTTSNLYDDGIGKL